MRRSSLAGAAALVTLLSLGQKLAAFVREQAIASAYGATRVADAYLVGMAIPELAWIVAASGITGALVPLLTRLVEGGDPDAARRVAASSILWSVLVTSGLTVVLYLLLPGLVDLATGAWTESEASLAVAIGVLALPGVAVAAAAAPLRSLLHANQVFLYTPLVVLIQNVLVAVLAVAAAGSGPQILALGQVAGIALHVLVFGWALRRLGQLPAGASLNAADLRPAYGLILPLAVWALALQAYAPVDRFLGGTLAAGSASALAYADKLRQLPLQTAMYAVTTVSYPALAAAVSAHDHKRLEEVLSQALRLVIMVALPVMVGLTVLSRPTVELVYERGAFDPAASAATAQAVWVLALAVLPLGAGALLAHTHFSLGRPWVPVVALAGGELIHLGFGAALRTPLGTAGIAWASLLGALVALGIQAASLRWLLWPQTALLVRGLRVPVLASGAMGVVCLVALLGLERLSTAWRDAGTALTIALATAVYVLVLWRGRVHEVKMAATWLRKRCGWPQ